MKLQETRIEKLYDYKRKDIQKHFEKLQKKAKKLGVAFTFELTPTYIHEEIERIEDSIKVDRYKVLDVLIEHEPIKLDGNWEILAIHSNESDSIFQVMKDIEIPKSFLKPTEKRTCEHCNHKRYRKTHFLVYSRKKKEHKVVGSTCLQDFCGVSPSKATQQYSIVESLYMNAGMEDDYGYLWSDSETKQKFVNIAYDRDTCISKTLELIKEKGYVKAEWERVDTGETNWNGYIIYKWERSNLGKATIDFVIKYLEEGYKKSDKPSYASKKVVKWWKDRSFNFTEVENEQYDFSKGKYIKVKLKVPKNDFDGWVQQTKELMKDKYIMTSDMSKLASAVGNYITTIEKEKARDKAQKLMKKKGAKSGFVGKVKDRIEFNLKIEKVYEGSSDWGAFYVINLVDENHNQYVYKGSKYLGEVDKKVSGKFTIKSHEVYNEAKQTHLTRPTLN